MKIPLAPMAEPNFETDFCHEAVCPYCGSRNPDVHEAFGGDLRDGAETEVDCNDCGEGYRIWVTVTIEYSMRKRKTPEASQ